MRILVIEDERGKLRSILEFLKTLDDVEVVTAQDVQTAKGHLASITFDLAIVDIVLPLSAELDPDPLGGVKLLQEIMQRDDVYRIPAHIIGLTAFDTAFESAEDSFALESWSLIHYNETEFSWQERIRRKLKQIIAANRARLTNTTEYESFACIVTALTHPELAAILRLSWDWDRLEADDDVSVYHVSSFVAGGKSRKVVAVSAARMGLAASTAVTSKVIMRFKPQYVAMAGIAGGFAPGCNVGDVLVSDPAWHWEAGKHSVVGGNPVFQPEPHQIFIDRKVRNKIVTVQNDAAFLGVLRNDFNGAKPDSALKILIGPTATGSAVLSDADFHKLIKDQNRKAIGLDMEAYGVYVAAEENAVPAPKAFAVKSVSDFADGTKNDVYQPYAAYTSANVLQRILIALGEKG